MLSRLDYVGKRQQTTADTQHARARSHFIQKETTFHLFSNGVPGCPFADSSTKRCLWSLTKYSSPVTRSTLEHYCQMMFQLETCAVERNDVVEPRTKLVIASRAFSVSAPRIWNSLSHDVRSAESVHLFQESKDVSLLHDLQTLDILLPHLRFGICIDLLGY